MLTTSIGPTKHETSSSVNEDHESTEIPDTTEPNSCVLRILEPMLEL